MYELEWNFDRHKVYWDAVTPHSHWRILIQEDGRFKVIEFAQLVERLHATHTLDLAKAWCQEQENERITGVKL